MRDSGVEMMSAASIAGTGIKTLLAGNIGIGNYQGMPDADGGVFWTPIVRDFHANGGCPWVSFYPQRTRYLSGGVTPNGGIAPNGDANAP